MRAVVQSLGILLQALKAFDPIALPSTTGRPDDGAGQFCSVRR